MSTPDNCNRADLTCQPDRTIIVQKPEKTESATISEKQFMHDHTIYSAASSWLFAIAGATNIGVISVFASRILGAIEHGKPVFKSTDPKVPAVFGNKKYNYAALAATAFGGVAMALSNWLESKKTVTEWQLGAGKMQRKAAGAERELEKTSPAEQASEAPAQPANMAESVQTKSPDSVAHANNLMLASTIAFVFVIITALPFQAYAENNFEAEFVRDKDYALNQLNPELEKQCLSDIAHKINAETKLKPIGKLDFNDAVSRVVYKEFYWKKSDRGVAFVMPVQAVNKNAGNITTDIACFYSMTDTGLEFQQAQQILRRL